MSDVFDKDEILSKKKINKNKINVIDLHGMSLDNANINIKKFIEESFEKKIYKIKVITGKGLRSKSYANPYLSSQYSNLKNSVPDFIKHDKSLLNKIKKIHSARPEEGGEGAFFVLLKNFKE